MSEKFNIRSLFVFPVAYFNQLRKHKIPVARNLKTKSTKLEQKIQKRLFLLKIHSVLEFQAFAPRGFLVAPTLKMVFEVCRSLALDQNNLFLLAFLPATGLALVDLEEGDN